MPDTQARWRCPILPVLALLAGGGCETSWRPSVSIRPQTRSIVMDHQTDGTHRRMEVTDPAWYQLTGSDLLVLDTTGRLISRQHLAPPGTSAPAMDLVTVGDRVAILLGDSEVVLLDRSDPWRPEIVERIDASSLGLWPTALGRRGDDVLALGRGSARTLSGGIVARSEGEQITSVLEHRERLLHVAGRRIHRRAGDQYLGTASLLQAAAPHRHLPEAALLFARNERSGALVGFLGDDCRELDATEMTVAVPGTVSRLRQRGGRVLVVADAGLTILRLTDAGLRTEWSWPITGLEDADWINDDRLAVAGTFGRGIVPIGVQTAQGPKRQRVNRDGIRSTGLEMVASAGWRGVQYSGDLTLQQAWQIEDGSGVKTRPEYEPGVVGGFRVAALAPGEFRLSGGYRFVGTQFCLNADSTSMDELRRTHHFELQLRRLFAVEGGSTLANVDALVSVTNLTDNAIFDQCGLPQPGRTFRIQLRLF